MNCFSLFPLRLYVLKNPLVTCFAILLKILKGRCCRGEYFIRNLLYVKKSSQFALKNKQAVTYSASQSSQKVFFHPAVNDAYTSYKIFRIIIKSVAINLSKLNNQLPIGTTFLLTHLPKIVLLQHTFKLF